MIRILRENAEREQPTLEKAQSTADDADDLQELNDDLVGKKSFLYLSQKIGTLTSDSNFYMLASGHYGFGRGHSNSAGDYKCLFMS
jgi:hypothetical protein